MAFEPEPAPRSTSAFRVEQRRAHSFEREGATHCNAGRDHYSLGAYVAQSALRDWHASSVTLDAWRTTQRASDATQRAIWQRARYDVTCIEREYVAQRIPRYARCRLDGTRYYGTVSADGISMKALRVRASIACIEPIHAVPLSAVVYVIGRYAFERAVYSTRGARIAATFPSSPNYDNQRGGDCK